MELPLKDKVALVSGASRGVGRIYALSLANAGARVIATARTLDGDADTPGSLRELVATAGKSGLKITAYRCDVEDEDSIAQAVRQAVVNFGGVDVLVNNSGALGQIPHLAIGREAWEHFMRVNLRAPYVFMRELIPQMIARGGGSIVNITAAAGGLTEPRTPAHDDVVHYAASKAGLDRLTTWFAAEYKAANIAVNSISPGRVTRYMNLARGQPDMRFWGDPLVYLALQRPDAGITGKVLHTYEYGYTFGPTPAEPPRWDEHITGLLREAGLVG